MTAYTTLKSTPVVTAFLRYERRILLLQCSDMVGSYQGRWSAVSGYLEDATLLLQARGEIREEVGLSDDEVLLVAVGEPIEVPAPELAKVWVVHPFLFAIDNPEHIKLDRENVEPSWMAPEEITNYTAVPKLENGVRTSTSEDSALHYQLMFSENRAIILLIDPNNGTIKDASVGACQYYGYSLSELTTMSISDIDTMSGLKIAAEIQRAHLHGY